MITDITVPRMMNNFFFATTNIAFQVLYNQLTNLVMLVKISLGVNSMRDIKRCVSSVFHIFAYSHIRLSISEILAYIAQFTKRIMP